MIKSFKSKETEKLFHRQIVLKWKSISEITRNKLEMIDAATRLEQLYAVPGNRLRKLEGKRKDYYRIWIDKQYRIIFYWGKDNHAYEVEISKHYEN